MDRMNVTMSTDGSCLGNHHPGPQPGGYAALLRFGNAWYELAGYNPQTTNNRMEIMACIEGVKVLNKPCTITVRTDSQNLINCISQLEARAKNGWKTKTGARVANCDLHQSLFKLKHEGNHEIIYEYVEGHSGDPDNERCDELAKQAISTKERYEARGRN